MTAAASGHGKLIAVGGWLRSPAYVAVKERFFGPLLRPMVEEAGARGRRSRRGWPRAYTPISWLFRPPGISEQCSRAFSRPLLPVSQVVQA